MTAAGTIFGPTTPCHGNGGDFYTSVPRTAGWHQFGINVAANSLLITIDGNQVWSVSGSYSFDTVALSVFGEVTSVVPHTDYFDDFSFTSGQQQPPTNLHAMQVGNNGTQIQLTWDYGSDPIDGFELDRQTPSQKQSGTWPTPPILVPLSACIPATSGRTCTFTDTVSPFNTYNYRVRAYKGGTESANSSEATCFQILLFTSRNITTMKATFQPDAYSITDAAQAFGYDHFNWISHITHTPNTLTKINGDVVPNPPPDVLDAPCGGWQGVPADCLPYYLNETFVVGAPPSLNLLDPASSTATSVTFHDTPVVSSGGGASYQQFQTDLVGVYDPIGTRTASPKFSPPLAGFTWSSNFGGVFGGIIDFTRTYNDDIPTAPTQGGIFNAALVQDLNALPTGLRAALSQEGAQGISTAPKIDKDAPMTAAFVSGPQGTNGWYTGPVTFTLIATDIDGPSDIAVTSYSLDTGPVVGYAGPIIPSSNGSHTIQFGSTDLAGNVETPRPSVTFKIDTTPPVVVPQVAGTLGNNGWYPSNVTVSWSVTDPESGIASSTGCTATTLTADTAGVTLTCSAINGAGLSSSVPVTIKIDRTPPTISGMPAAGCSLWPPNGKLVQVATVTATDILSGVAPGSFNVTGTSNEPSSDPTSPEIVITSNGSGGFVVQLQADRLGTGSGRGYTLTATASDMAGNPATAAATCTVPHDQGN
jgi:hypothetical protein